MTKYYYGLVEWWPIYELTIEQSVQDGVACEFTGVEIDAIKAAAFEFGRWQGVIAKRFGIQESNYTTNIVEEKP